MKVLAVTSGKGGTGKSCIAAYTGIALAKQGYRTLLVELGASFKALDLIVGLQDQVVFDAGDILSGNCPAEKAILPCTNYKDLYLLPSPLRPVIPGKNRQLHEMVAALKRQFDFVILDGVDFSVLSPGVVDMILQVLTPDSLCIRACAQQARELFDEGAKEIRLVINNVPARILPMYGASDFDDVIDIVGVQLIAIIPSSPKLQFSSNNAQALDEETITVRIFDNLASRILGRRVPLLIR